MELSKAYELFGLDPSKLQIQDLLKNRSYRRLFNIVATDQTHSDSMFRPNLIKELYFLLQITPFIDKTLQQQFLTSIEDWYNSNDHKKIQLSSNLQGKIEQILKAKKSQHAPRPKTGVQWDSSLNPFLRPYTAKINQHKNIPDKNQLPASTKISTFQMDSLEGENPKLKNVIDIEEEWERSQDFIHKFRTLHPQEEPTYEKLLNLIERASQMGSQYHSKSQEKTKPKRKIASALIKREKSREFAEFELNEERKNQEQDNQIQENVDENCFQEQENDDGEESAQMQEQKKKCFLTDKRTASGNKVNRIYKNVNGLRILRPLTGKQAAIVQRLDVYSRIEKNITCIKNNEDFQFADHFRSYVRKKTTLKKELARKTESIRILKSAHKEPSKKQNGQNQNIGLRKENTFNLREFPLAESKNELNRPKTTHYHENNFFKDVYSQKLRVGMRNLEKKVLNQEGKQNKIEDKKVELPIPAGLAKNKRFSSEYKFNPLNIVSRDEYNQQILCDIQKIKQKFGGKISISTGTLIKAMHVQTPLEDNQFQIPNRGYLMLSNGEKKKKKKGKKGKKGKSGIKSKAK